MIQYKATNLINNASRRRSGKPSDEDENSNTFCSFNHQRICFAMHGESARTERLQRG